MSSNGLPELFSIATNHKTLGQILYQDQHKQNGVTQVPNFPYKINSNGFITHTYLMIQTSSTINTTPTRTIRTFNVDKNAS
jgi:hypothetical protein